MSSFKLVDWPMAAAALTIFLIAAGCERQPPSDIAEDQHHDHDHDHDHSAETSADHNPTTHHDQDAETHHDGHDHQAPHGGALLPLGDHFAHLELVLDNESGELTIYVLDSHADNALRLAQPTIRLSWWVPMSKTAPGEKSHLTARPRKNNLELTAVESALTGEKVGDTSEFRGRSDDLRGVERFEGIIPTLSIKGQTLNDIPVHYPAGGELDHE